MLTYAVLHSDFVHLASNVFSQIMIGSFVERAIGTWRVLGLYVATA